MDPDYCAETLNKAKEFACNSYIHIMHLTSDCMVYVCVRIEELYVQVY